MSRMQNILDKAERDGAVLRLRALPDQDPIEAGDRKSTRLNSSH